MCGIAGIAAWRRTPPAREDVTRMCDAMVHRGPDDAGYLVEDSVALGMRRLSIIDLSGGHQPIFNEDGSVAVFYNGEIYNYLELRAELEAKGHRFATNSDTEVIVHLWEEEGVEFPRRLNGMFAIALYDRIKRRLVLVRDHVGIKPLYYALGADGIVFGSEVKVLLASGRVGRTLDVDALGQYLSWEYVPGAGTLLREVRRLEPARSLEIDLESGRTTIRRYWSPLGAGTEPVRSDGEWEERVEAAIKQAVRRQLMSDVPLGAFLSGGVDSSLVVAAMGTAETFSIGFDDPSYDETRLVEPGRGSSRGQSPHRDHSARRRRTVRSSDAVPGRPDRQLLDLPDLSRLAPREQARQGGAVGRRRRRALRRLRTFLAQQKSLAWSRIPKWLRSGVMEPVIGALPPTAAKKGLVNKAKRFVEGARLDPAWGHARWRVFCDERVRNALLTPAAREHVRTDIGAQSSRYAKKPQRGTTCDKALYVDFGSYLVDNCLTKVDPYVDGVLDRGARAAAR